MNPEWVEAGARALNGEWRRVPLEDMTTEIAASAVIAAVEPLIREQIAAEIERVPQYCTFMADGSLDGGDAILRSDAARIARGESK